MPGFLEGNSKVLTEKLARRSSKEQSPLRVRGPPRRMPVQSLPPSFLPSLSSVGLLGRFVHRGICNCGAPLKYKVVVLAFVTPVRPSASVRLLCRNRVNAEHDGPTSYEQASKI